MEEQDAEVEMKGEKKAAMDVGVPLYNLAYPGQTMQQFLKGGRFRLRSNI